MNTDEVDQRVPGTAVGNNFAVAGVPQIHIGPDGEKICRPRIVQDVFVSHKKSKCTMLAGLDFGICINLRSCHGTDAISADQNVALLG